MFRRSTGTAAAGPGSVRGTTPGSIESELKVPAGALRGVGAAADGGASGVPAVGSKARRPASGRLRQDFGDLPGSGADGRRCARHKTVGKKWVATRSAPSRVTRRDAVTATGSRACARRPKRRAAAVGVEQRTAGSMADIIVGNVCVAARSSTVVGRRRTRASRRRARSVPIGWQDAPVVHVLLMAATVDVALARSLLKTHCRAKVWRRPMPTARACSELWEQRTGTARTGAPCRRPASGPPGADAREPPLAGAGAAGHELWRHAGRRPRCARGAARLDTITSSHFAGDSDSRGAWISSCCMTGVGVRMMLKAIEPVPGRAAFVARPRPDAAWSRAGPSRSRRCANWA